MFRGEVSASVKGKLDGDVLIAVPLSWQVICWLILFGVGCMISFLSLASYSRVETIGGVIVPKAGVVPILPMRNGVVQDIVVQEGDLVAPGTLLASIRTEEDSRASETALDRIEAAIARRDASLAAQMEELGTSAAAQQQQMEARRSGIVSDVMQIRSQVSMQKALVALAQKDLESARLIADRGFVSARDLRQREEMVIARQQGLSQLRSALLERQTSLVELERSRAQVHARMRAETAGLAAIRAEGAERAAGTAAARSYALKAPVGGYVTAVAAKPGIPVTPKNALMVIVPKSSILRAELGVPSSAIGFVKPGQIVRMEVAAFPYQKFGTIRGRILTVAKSPAGQLYPVVAALDQYSISAYGRKEPLLPGMTLTARIVTEKQSLFEWLFEPVFAVGRR